MLQNDPLAGAKDEIAVYQYSALLDDDTCKTCVILDGAVVEYKEYSGTKWQPGWHDGCRCIWLTFCIYALDVAYWIFDDKDGILWLHIAN